MATVIHGRRILDAQMPGTFRIVSPNGCKSMNRVVPHQSESIASSDRESRYVVVGRAVLPRTIRDRDAGRAAAGWILSHYPVPRLRVMLTPLFWLKRLPTHKD